MRNPSHDPTRGVRRRRGAIVVLAAAMLVMVFGFAAFSVDVGYITLTKARLQAACDAGTLAAALELPEGLGIDPELSATQTKTACGAAAKDVVGRHQAGGIASVHLDQTRDTRYGRVTWSTATNSWVKTWDVAPYNLVEVTVRRDQATGAPDGPLNLFFGPVIGHREATLVVDAQAAVLPAMGFQVKNGSPNAGVLPFTVDWETWQDYTKAVDGLSHTGSYGDDFSFNPDTGAVTSGSDGIVELSMYPYGNQELPPGNRGTVDFGHTGNSTADLKRQILDGLNASDLAYFPDGKIVATWANPLIVNGDTGISAGFKAELDQIKGKPRSIPIFTEVSGNGNNAMYTLVKFVGIRIVNVKLSGNPKRVLIQPGLVSDGTAVPDQTGTVTPEDGVVTRPVILQ